MSEYCNNGLTERFNNKIPQFLAHLDIWNEEPMNDCAATPRAYKRALSQQKVQAVCVICGKVYEKGRYEYNRKTCGRACGGKLARIHHKEKLDRRKAENAKYKNQKVK